MYGICRHFARPERAALAAACCTLGTTIIYYGSVQLSMAHGIATTVIAALVWYWLKTYGSVRPGRWLLVGILLGLACLIRWQLATFALLPAGEAFVCGWRSCLAGSRRQAGRLLGCLAVAAGGAVLGFAPQMIGWRCVYGYWLVVPMPLTRNWLQPALWEVLGSQDRSLFYWTPLTLLPVLGYLSYFFQGRRFMARRPAGFISTAAPGQPEILILLVVAFAAQVYVLASIRGTGVVLGSAYGFRQLTEALVVLAPGLALLLERASPRRYHVYCWLACALVAWNLLLICQYRHFLVPPDAGASPVKLLENMSRFTHRHGVVFLGQLAGPILLAWLLGRTAQRPAAGRIPSAA